MKTKPKAKSPSPKVVKPLKPRPKAPPLGSRFSRLCRFLYQGFLDWCAMVFRGITKGISNTLLFLLKSLYAGVFALCLAITIYVFMWSTVRGVLLVLLLVLACPPITKNVIKNTLGLISLTLVSLILYVGVLVNVLLSPQHPFAEVFPTFFRQSKLPVQVEQPKVPEDTYDKDGNLVMYDVPDLQSVKTPAQRMADQLQAQSDPSVPPSPTDSSSEPTEEPQATDDTSAPKPTQNAPQSPSDTISNPLADEKEPAKPDNPVQVEQETKKETNTPAEKPLFEDISDINREDGFRIVQ